jgi:hypothetical protein
MGAGLTPAGVAVRPPAAKSSENAAGEADIGQQIPRIHAQIRKTHRKNMSSVPLYKIGP